MARDEEKMKLFLPSSMAEWQWASLFLQAPAEITVILHLKIMNIGSAVYGAAAVARASREEGERVMDRERGS